MNDDRDDDAIIPWTVLDKLIPFGRTHVLRLEKTGAFPLRLRVGQNRVGWRWSEIKEWLQTRPRG